MSYFLEKYISIYSTILNFIYHLTSKISDRVRNNIISISCFYLIYYRFAQHAVDDPLMYHFDNWAILFFISIVLLIIMGNNKEIKNIKCNKKFCYVYSILLIMIALNLTIYLARYRVIRGDAYDDKFIVMTFMLMFVFPALYIVWNNRKDYEVLFDRLAMSGSIFCIIYFFGLFNIAYKGQFPMMESGLFKGSTTNSNNVGSIAAICSMSSLYLMYRYQNRKALFVFNSFSMACALKLMIKSNCRTAMVGLILCIISIVIFLFKTNNEKQILNFVISIALFYILSSILYYFLIHLYAEKSGYDIVENIHLIKKFGTTISSNRTNIWKNYFKYFNLFGNNIDVLRDNPVLYNGIQFMNAHNNVIHITFKFGIPIGLLYFYKLIYTGISCIKLLFNKNANRPYHLFLIFVVFMFASYACFEVSTTFFMKTQTLLFYIVTMVLFDESEIDA